MKQSKVVDIQLILLPALRAVGAFGIDAFGADQRRNDVSSLARRKACICIAHFESRNGMRAHIRVHAESRHMIDLVNTSQQRVMKVSGGFYMGRNTQSRGMSLGNESFQDRWIEPLPAEKRRVILAGLVLLAVKQICVYEIGLGRQAEGPLALQIGLVVHHVIKRTFAFGPGPDTALDVALLNLDRMPSGARKSAV